MGKGIQAYRDKQGKFCKANNGTPQKIYPFQRATIKEGRICLEGNFIDAEMLRLKDIDMVKFFGEEEESTEELNREIASYAWRERPRGSNIFVAGKPRQPYGRYNFYVCPILYLRRK